MHAFNPDDYKVGRSKPSQARGKERVRVILAAALGLFKEKGVDDVTTNDIAKSAGIPIGSLYRYYPNKDAIINALFELYINDMSRLFDEISEHPFLPDMSWDEVFLLLAEAWANYGRLNGPFDFLYALKANPRLDSQNHPSRQKLRDSFNKVVKRRCPLVTDNQLAICFSYIMVAAEMSTKPSEQKTTGPLLYQEAIGIIAEYMLRVCNHKH